MIEKPFLNSWNLMALPTPKKSPINKFSEYFKVVSILLVASLFNILCIYISTSDQNICNVWCLIVLMYHLHLHGFMRINEHKTNQIPVF